MHRRKVYTVNEVSFNIQDEVIGEERDIEEENDNVFTDIDQESSCDWIFCRPKQCQKFGNLNCAMIWISGCALVLGMASSGLINNVVEAAEQRFSIDSTRSAIIASCYHFGIFLTILPISFFGNGCRKPRMLAVGMLLVALGSTLFCIPSFFQNRIKTITQLSNISDSMCLHKEFKLKWACSNLINWLIWILWIASFILGVGSAPILSLGIRYIDENSGKSKAPVNIGFFYFAYLVGVGGGFAMTSEYDAELSDTSFNRAHFGENWWIGFLVMAIASVLLCIPIMGLPKIIKEKHDHKPNPTRFTEKRPSVAYAAIELMSSRASMTCQDLMPSLKSILSNSTFMCVSFSMAARVALLTGIITFGQKYVDTTFYKDAQFSFTLSGIYAIPASIIGNFLGAFFVGYSKATVSTSLRAMIIISLFTFFCLCLFLMRCSSHEDQSLKYVGLTIDYDKTNPDPLMYPQLNDVCNANCSCNVRQHLFICGADNRIYYSPCHAGCRTTNANGTMFGNCSCIKSSLKNYPNYQAKSGKCQMQCQSFWLFQLLLVFLLLLNCFIIVPHVSVTFRSVAEQQRTLALGIQWMIITFFGAIPGPLVFGFVIDRACVSWMDACDLKGRTKGVCVFYLEHKLRFTILIISFISLGLVSIFLAIAVMIHRKPKVGRSLDMYLHWQDRRLSSVTVPRTSYGGLSRQQSVVESVSSVIEDEDLQDKELDAGLTLPFKILRIPSQSLSHNSLIISSNRKRQLSEPRLNFCSNDEEDLYKSARNRARRTQSSAPYDKSRSPRILRRQAGSTKVHRVASLYEKRDISRRGSEYQGAPSDRVSSGEVRTVFSDIPMGRSETEFAHGAAVNPAFSRNGFEMNTKGNVGMDPNVAYVSLNVTKL